MALKALWLELLDCHDNPSPGFRGPEGILIDPSFEDISKTSFSKKAFGAEAVGSGSQFTEAECLGIVTGQ